ncbi:Linoleate 13S-lipoxygenase 3-1, chloroplastic-like protein [Drosera capensis]
MTERSNATDDDDSTMAEARAAQGWPAVVGKASPRSGLFGSQSGWRDSRMSGQDPCVVVHGRSKSDQLLLAIVDESSSAASGRGWPDLACERDLMVVATCDDGYYKEALDAKRLFIAGYHDVFLPFLERINALDGRKTYATRTLFFLTDLCTLMPIAIQLCLPLAGPNSNTRRVVRPPVDATSFWTWRLLFGLMTLAFIGSLIIG